ncbi:hypothetical protein P278_24430 [Zhouia amylolytica AD3]|uniref:DUF4260 domain-containing protein n=2 Tax=Zhouia amylolytica TaxID=376730 RepID=W2UK01_9FLAO|nr:hypothetical protein P278_24430 [Zhouia amylolytica AD3]
MLGLAIYLFSTLSFAWWWFLVLILLPDIGMLGYVFNPKTGAFTYNLFHHKAVAVLMFFLGLYLANEYIQLIGIIIFGHASFDRALGYGLKYPTSFHDTHLGKIGNTNE